MTISDSTIPLKHCRKCGRDLPATTEYFHSNFRYATGLSSNCKDCKKAANARYRAENPEKVREIKKRWDSANRPRMRELQANWNKKHPDRAREQSNRWRAKNPEKFIVYKSRRKARKLSLPDTFAATEYNTMMDYWNGCCAYCGAQRDFWHNIAADHFIPLNSPTCPGTVASNMIPACNFCNTSKSDKNPVQWTEGKFGKRKAKQILKRIGDYLNTVK